MIAFYCTEHSNLVDEIDGVQISFVLPCPQLFTFPLVSASVLLLVLIPHCLTLFSFYFTDSVSSEVSR